MDLGLFLSFLFLQLLLIFFLPDYKNKLHILLVDNQIHGYIYLSRLSIDEWEVKSVAAINKNGYKIIIIRCDPLNRSETCFKWSFRSSGIATCPMR